MPTYLSEHGTVIKRTSLSLLHFRAFHNFNPHSQHLYGFNLYVVVFSFVLLLCGHNSGYRKVLAHLQGLIVGNIKFVVKLTLYLYLCTVFW